jgi:hypothetical protein
MYLYVHRQSVVVIRLGDDGHREAEADPVPFTPTDSDSLISVKVLCVPHSLRLFASQVGPPHLDGIRSLIPSNAPTSTFISMTPSVPVTILFRTLVTQLLE